MGSNWREEFRGPRTTPPALAAMARAHEALAEAGREVAGAGQIPWVSAAADLYRDTVADALGDVSRLGAALGAAHVAVLRHTRDGDAAQQATEDALTIPPPFVSTLWSAP